MISVGLSERGPWNRNLAGWSVRERALELKSSWLWSVKEGALKLISNLAGWSVREGALELISSWLVYQREVPGIDI